MQHSTHLVAERVHGDAEGAGETEVTDLELSAAVDQQILRLQVAVEYPVRVAEGDTLGSAPRPHTSTHVQQLVGEVLDGVEREGATISVRVHVALEVLLAVLENEDELGLGVNDVVEADNVDVLELCLLALHHMRSSPADAGRPWASRCRTQC